jgi:hypothetical protein
LAQSRIKERVSVIVAGRLEQKLGLAHKVARVLVERVEHLGEASQTDSVYASYVRRVDEKKIQDEKMLGLAVGRR